MNRFFIDPAGIQGDRVRLDGQQARQICRVLRLGAHDRIVVLDNAGTEYEVVLTAVGPAQVMGEVIERRLARGEPPVDLTLYQSLLARDKFEHVLQKCTEVGVRRFVPVVTERSLVRNARAFNEDRLGRWVRILTEAAEQSGRGRVPELGSPVRFEQALADPTASALRLMASPCVEGPSLRGLGLDSAGAKAAALFIGPEGGFAPGEQQLARSAGWTPFSLGRRVLRTETAAVVASALVLHQMGQMEP